ncbi:hypothetical protein FNF27_02668 [Cafeteria roenbergensis]|uniref:Methyltransferase domain-containing protein n=1 Tax=Cafeteria roenbergensis TaxID=33653 RepID=A0A5A8EGW0_CAFRO|nr:hypothetical protein FNF27_02668 [Cafeteria roenbergensis]
MEGDASVPSAPAAGASQIMLPGIVLTGLRTFLRAKQVETAVASLGLEGFVGASKKPGKHMAFLGFETVEQRDAALSALESDPSQLDKAVKGNGKVRAKNAVRGVRADDVRPREKRPRDPDAAGETDAKRPRSETPAASAPRSVHEATTPLLALPYAEQLLYKQEQTVRMGVKLVRSIRNSVLKAIRKTMAKGSADEVKASSDKAALDPYLRVPPEYLPIELWDRAVWVSPGLGERRAPLDPECQAAPSPTSSSSSSSLAAAAASVAATAGPGSGVIARVLGGSADAAAALSESGSLGVCLGSPELVSCSGRVFCAPIVPSPVTLGFRNKCGFTVSARVAEAPAEAPETVAVAELPAAAAATSAAPNGAGVPAGTAAPPGPAAASAAPGEVVVGFRVGSFKEGSAVAPCAPSAVTPAAAKAAAQIFEAAIPTSGAACFDKHDEGKGVWRMLTVRVSEATGEVMLVLEIAADDDVVKAVAEAAKASIACPSSAAPDAQTEAAAAEVAGAGPLPGAPLPDCLSALPAEVAAAVVRVRDTLLGTPLRMLREEALPETEAEGLPALPDMLRGGGSDLRVSSACASMLLQAAGSGPVAGRGLLEGGRRGVTDVAAHVLAASVAPGDAGDAAAVAAAAAAAAPMMPSTVSASGGAPTTDVDDAAGDRGGDGDDDDDDDEATAAAGGATPGAASTTAASEATEGGAKRGGGAHRKPVSNEQKYLRAALAAGTRAAAARAAGAVLGPTAADYARAGLPAPRSRPAVVPRPLDSSVPAEAPAHGLADGRVGLVGVAPAEGPAAPPRVTSLYLQVCRRVSHYGGDHTSPLVRLAGTEFIRDAILGRRFRVSPTAFFQTNTLGACRLYGAVRDAVEGTGAAAAMGPPCPALDTSASVPASVADQWAAEAVARDPAVGPGPGSFDRVAVAAPVGAAAATAAADASARPRIILDVFCGSGTIGIAMARPGLDAVVGVELNASAVQDARKNAADNGLRVLDEGGPAAAADSDARGTADYIASRAETAMTALFERAGLERRGDGQWELPAAAGARFGGVRPAVIAIVDPPRAGLGIPVIHALRACAAISRLVYVSCNPFGTFPDNATNLCTYPTAGRGPTAFKHTPFRPVFLQPVDMFPHTDHTELVSAFERAPPAYSPSSQLVRFAQGTW